MNRTLLSMLKTLQKDQKSRWHLHVSKMVHAYNCTKNEATGFSPFFLLFGRTPRLPVDLIFGLEDQDHTKPVKLSVYAETFSKALKEAYAKATSSAKAEAAQNERQYNKKVRAVDLRPGDRVLVRNLSQRGGPGKLRSYWEDVVHVVVRRMEEGSPVFEVKPEVGRKTKPRVLHRNMLLPCDALPFGPAENQVDLETDTGKPGQTSRPAQTRETNRPKRALNPAAPAFKPRGTQGKQLAAGTSTTENSGVQGGRWQVEADPASDTPAPGDEADRNDVTQNPTPPNQVDRYEHADSPGLIADPERLFPQEGSFPTDAASPVNPQLASPDPRTSDPESPLPSRPISPPPSTYFNPTPEETTGDVPIFSPAAAESPRSRDSLDADMERMSDESRSTEDIPPLRRPRERHQPFRLTYTGLGQSADATINTVRAAGQKPATSVKSKPSYQKTVSVKHCWFPIPFFPHVCIE